MDCLPSKAPSLQLLVVNFIFDFITKVREEQYLLTIQPGTSL